MKLSALSILACPSCKSTLTLSSDCVEGGEIMEGTLSCTGCGTTFPIRDGIPSLVPARERESHVTKSFGFEWQTHHDGGFEKETVFGRDIEELVAYFFEGLSVSEKDIRGKRVLDAGCGHGVLTMEIAGRYPQTEFVAFDINPAIGEVFRKGGRLPNLHVVHGSVLDPPFPSDSFDFVWCNGVIHHTGDTRRAFSALTSLTKDGGRAYFWVYEKKLSPMVGLRKILRPLGLVHWNHKFLYRFCQVIAFFTWLALFLISPLGKLKSVQRHAHLKILTLQRGFDELALTWFDVLSPMYRDTYGQREFESWFEECGFTDLSRYWWPVGVCGVKRVPTGLLSGARKAPRMPERIPACVE
jgi:uncharacterized protein YbaR (Trm112 family)/SAM-dependent methyltransferase